MELAISILGYITQLTQIIGWRINLLLGGLFFGSLSWFTFSEGLYANAIIRCVAAGICFMGFLNWKTSIYIFKKWHLLLYVIIVFFVAVIQLEFTNNPVPILNTIFISLNLIAIFLMASRSIYCWVIFMILNAMEIGMFFIVHNYYLSSMQFVYLLTSIAGIIIWKKKGVDRSLATN